MLAWTVYISFAGVLVLMLLPRGRPAAARGVALLTALLGLAAGVAGAIGRNGELQPVVEATWISSMGIKFYLAADGISLILVVLTGIAACAGILFSWNIEERTNEFFAFYLALIGGVYGVFLSFDVFLLFVFYELAIIPKYFLIAIWGSTRREYGAMKLALYSFFGSAMVLAGILAAYVAAGAKTTNLVELAQYPYPISMQMWAFPLVFVGFAILAGLWPFHTWAPTGHVAAPTGASMLLAGVVMKLGAYGALRVAMTLFPRGLDDWNIQSYSTGLLNGLASHSFIENVQWALHLLGFVSWRELFALLGAIGIVYGATVALVQTDFKFVIGYSSVSHMGFVLLGLMTASAVGLSGAALQMFSHGIIAGLLFAVVGRMVYDRTHTRDLTKLEQMDLRKWLPGAAVIFTLAGFASMGFPGFSGFVAELQVLIGAWSSQAGCALLAGCGILVGVAFMLRAMHKAFFAEPAEDHGAGGHRLPGLSVPEKIGGALLLVISVAVGLYPSVLLDLIRTSIGSPLFDGLRKGGAF